MSANHCHNCDSFLEWPRECGWCGGWFCGNCVAASAHDCPEAARESDDEEYRAVYDEEPPW